MMLNPFYFWEGALMKLAGLLLTYAGSNLGKCLLSIHKNNPSDPIVHILFSKATIPLIGPTCPMKA
jgi:hypothetical protein